jgi:dihydropteroate synthase
VIRAELDALADDAQRLWLRPIALVAGDAGAAAVERGLALPLAGSAIAFTAVEALARRGADIVAAVASLAALGRWSAGQTPAARARIESRLEALAARRADWAGFALDRPLLMGILNITPDSFSDGGRFLAPEDAVAQGCALLAAGADIIDVGGESTRPGAQPVAPNEETRRLAPVIGPLAASGAIVSVDTRHAAVMEMALAAGARIVNDVTALAGDPASLGVVARRGAAVVLMHMQGEPRTMQLEPRYALPSLDVVEALAARVEACVEAGIPAARIVVDPGIGFGKSEAHNLEILARLSLCQALGTGVMVGLSRKSLVGRTAGAGVDARLPGSLAGALHALGQGAQILRVHDVAETRQAVTLWRAIAAGG